MVLTQSTPEGSEEEEVGSVSAAEIKIEVRGSGIGPEICAGNWNKPGSLMPSW